MPGLGLKEPDPHGAIPQAKIPIAQITQGLQLGTIASGSIAGSRSITSVCTYKYSRSPLNSSSFASRCQPVKHGGLTENKTKMKAQTHVKIMTSHVQAVSTTQSFDLIIPVPIYFFPLRISVRFWLIRRKNHFELKKMLEIHNHFLWKYLDRLSQEGLYQGKGGAGIAAW